jgi:uncharacterized protein (TIGR02246 family)
MCKVVSRVLSGTACGCSLAAMAVVLVALAARAQAADEKPANASDVQAIRAAIDSYVAAYNRGDAKAVAALWSESGEWISPSGERFQGRKAIEKELRTLFAENKGVRIEVLNPSVRIVSPDVAVEEGTVRVNRPGTTPSESTYLAVDVKKNGKWKLDTVRETDLPEESPASSPLQDLAWLVGQWKDAGGLGSGATTIAWTKNKTFLTYSFKVSAPGMDDLEGTQVIGWDPAGGTIRSWMFDSDGGFGEGVWTKKDNSWVVKFSQVLPDGRKASATNVYTIINDNAFTWKSVGRQVDGQYLPNVDEVKMVRKTAGEAIKEKPKAAKQPQVAQVKK